MSECKSCGGFVTDNYARVFGDNNDDVYDCRNCRTGRGRDGSAEDNGEDDGRTVLLRSVRGEDQEYVASRGAESSGASEDASSDDAIADGGRTADAADEDSTDGGAEGGETDRDGTADAGQERSGLGRFLPSFGF